MKLKPRRAQVDCQATHGVGPEDQGLQSIGKEGSYTCRYVWITAAAGASSGLRGHRKDPQYYRALDYPPCTQSLLEADHS